MRHPYLRRAMAVALGVWLTLLGLDRLSAYVINGPRWPSSAVSYFVNPANADVTQANALAAVQVAASAWSLQTLADVQLQYAGPTTGGTVANNGKNEVFFSPESSGSTIAVCYYWYNGANQIVDSDIKFYDGGFKFHTGTSGCSSGMYIEDVGTHEFGHFIGLGHSAVSAATLYPTISYCSQSGRVLDADDIAGVETLYPAGSAEVPAAPYNLAVSQNAAQPQSSLRLTWTDASTTESGFKVERSQSATTGFAQVASLAAGTTTYTNIGLTAGMTYYYRVRAFNVAGDSGYSETRSGTTAAAASAPAKVTSPSPANGATNVVSTTVAWAAASTATSYDVYLGTSASALSLKGTTTSTSFSLGKLAAGTLYFWRVDSRNGAGTTTGDTWSFTTKLKGRR